MQQAQERKALLHKALYNDAYRKNGKAVLLACYMSSVEDAPGGSNCFVTWLEISRTGEFMRVVRALNAQSQSILSATSTS